MGFDYRRRFGRRREYVSRAFRFAKISILVFELCTDNGGDNDFVAERRP